MRMFNKLPRTIYINNKEIIVNTDYRIFVRFEVEMQENDTKKAIRNVLSSFYPAFLLREGITNEMVDKFIWFYKCGITEEEEKSLKSNNKASTRARAYDYRYDSDLIFGAFMETYRIDLSRANLHWWKFKALLKSLNGNTEFCKIKSYRMYDGEDKNLLELKEAYKLPPSKQEIEAEIRRDKLYEALK